MAADLVCACVKRSGWWSAFKQAQQERVAHLIERAFARN
jgi:hypothetical protein